MSSPEFPLGKSRVVAGRYPPPGIDIHADAIRERRGARGITPLDANLLHVPPVAGGFNTLLGAIRTKGKLPGDIREAMILRVAAFNHASFEWIHHEIIGRKEGLSTGQLYVIRDTKTPLPPLKTILTPLQTAAVAFTDHSTHGVRVPMDIIQELKHQLKVFVTSGNPSMSSEDVDSKVDDLYVEAAMVVASYNMVSRFLLATDVAGISDMEVPWPVDKKEHFVSLPSFPPALTSTHTIHAITLITSPTAPWLVFANSLLTDWTMWNYIIPYFLDLPSSTSTIPDSTAQKQTYNILLHSQRGHGLSTLPSPSSDHGRLTTIPLLATDIANLLTALSIPTPVHSVIGVSQGGAASLAFAALHGSKTKGIVACDTAPRTPVGNKEAWAERIRLASGPLPEKTTSDEDKQGYATHIGMRKLGNVTVPRWFPTGSFCAVDTVGGNKRRKWVEETLERTKLDGFVQGALALSDYDVLSLQLPASDQTSEAKPLLTSSVKNVLLLAGTLDGGGKVANALRDLQSTWKAAAPETMSIQFVAIDGAGHLPMIDSPEMFCQHLGKWLSEC
ncbi:alpha/beta-hydrolase [Phlegmacium glaucopus]|nr:alpha/beta-hydrolase [Phlegmacium glaucopus]